MKETRNLVEKDLFTIDRRAKIIDLLENNGQVKVTDLSDMFNVSEVTVRNDLSQLEGKGLLIRTRGGGIKTQRVGIDNHLNDKSKRSQKEKQLIGKKAAELVNNGDTIIIDSGTTTVELAKNLLTFNSLTVITNALNIASQLISSPQIKIIMLGGMLRHKSLSLIGPLAEKSIQNYFCDKLFIGVDGIDAEYGISTPNHEEAHLNRLMIDISKEVVVIADSSKFLRRSFAFISPMSKINTLITDSGIPKSEMTILQNAGINLIIV